MTKSLCAALIVSALLLPRSLFAELERRSRPMRRRFGLALGLCLGLTAGLLSFILTGGDTEVTQQAWQNSAQGPYLITPAVAKKAIGERPELQEKSEPTSKY